jgi:hypothetical protein
MYEEIPNKAYWRCKTDLYPALSCLARKYLCIPASSVYSERLFSEYGNLYEKKRSRLTPEIAEKVLFLHHNWGRVENNGRKPLDSDAAIASMQEAQLVLVHADDEDVVLVVDDDDKDKDDDDADADLFDE